ncbi:MAG: DUF4920 domain-containing protein [Myxococcales bacterium]|nr:DUF4920 domain-containing protein [Myxococcales bacterium]
MSRWIYSALLLAACNSASAPSEPTAAAPAEAKPAAAQPAEAHPAQGPTSQPTSMPSPDGYEASEPSPQADGTALYGDPFDPKAPEVALAELLASPEKYADATVRTRGVVARVCKNMGCWIEIKQESGEGELRAPLAGHSYFLPQSATGKHADVQGIVVVQELTDEQKAHMEAEGAKATSNVRIVATGVALKGATAEEKAM